MHVQVYRKCVCEHVFVCLLRVWCEGTSLHCGEVHASASCYNLHTNVTTQTWFHIRKVYGQSQHPCRVGNIYPQCSASSHIVKERKWLPYWRISLLHKYSADPAAPTAPTLSTGKVGFGCMSPNTQSDYHLFHFQKCSFAKDKKWGSTTLWSTSRHLWLPVSTPSDRWEDSLLGWVVVSGKNVGSPSILLLVGPGPEEKSVSSCCCCWTNWTN